MDIEALRSLVVVARTGSVTRAAEELFVTQPTLSRRLTALETELGVQLLVRTYEGVSLTKAGEALEREAESIVARLDALSQLVKQTDEAEDKQDVEGPAGPFHVMAQAMLDDRLVSGFMAQLMEHCPALEVQIERAYPPEIRQALAKQRADVAFFLRPVGSSISQLLTRKVGESRAQLMVYDEHPFARRSSVNIHELAGQDIIMLDRRVSPEIVDFISSRCVEAGFSLNAVRYVRDIENAAVLVSAGRGIAFVHSMMRFSRPLESVGIQVLDITGADMAIDYVARLRTGLSDQLRDAILDRLDDIAKA